MKRILILLFSFLTSVSFSQQYFPFPTTAATWTYQYYDDFHNPTSIFTCYSMHGDTIIGLNNYKKIFSGAYLGALRESSKIIYFVPYDSIQEFVLYDFNLNAGDTLFNPFGSNVNNSDTIIVYGVDSVLLQNGYHRRLYLGWVQWIEGIGSFNYLLNPTLNLPVSGNDQLACFADSTFFVIPGSYCCVTGIREIKKGEYFLISPNPSSGKFTIQSSIEKISQITITNLSGQTIYKKELSGFPLGVRGFEIDLTNQSKGIYLIQVIADKEVYNQKIILN